MKQKTKYSFKHIKQLVRAANIFAWVILLIFLDKSPAFGISVTGAFLFIFFYFFRHFFYLFQLDSGYLFNLHIKRLRV